MLACDLSPAKDFDRRPSVRRFRSVIVEPTRQRKRPEIDFELIRPVQECMLHHGASLLSDGADGAFGDAVLVMSANAGEVKFLLNEGLTKFVQLEHPIVAVVILDLLTAGFCDTLNGPFGNHCVRCMQRDLMETLNVTAGVITEDGAACIFVSETSLSSPSSETTTNG